MSCLSSLEEECQNTSTAEADMKQQTVWGEQIGQNGIVESRKYLIREKYIKDSTAGHGRDVQDVWQVPEESRYLDEQVSGGIA